MSRSIHGLYDGSGQSLESTSAANTSNMKQLRDELLPALKAAIQDKVVNDIEAWATQLDSVWIAPVQFTFALSFLSFDPK
jgi:hypothetical protein